jgi:hypothetical protein
MTGRSSISAYDIACLDQGPDIYYGGHGYLNDNRQHIWCCTSQPNAPSVSWFAHQVSFENLDCDVLMLFDCCTSGGVTGNAKNGLKEIISACGFETWAPGVRDHHSQRA